jgi:hypothetical protein
MSAPSESADSEIVDWLSRLSGTDILRIYDVAMMCNQAEFISVHDYTMRHSATTFKVEKKSLGKLLLSGAGGLDEGLYGSYYFRFMINGNKFHRVLSIIHLVDDDTVPTAEETRKLFLKELRHDLRLKQADEERRQKGEPTPSKH